MFLIPSIKEYCGIASVELVWFGKLNKMGEMIAKIHAYESY